MKSLSFYLIFSAAIILTLSCESPRNAHSMEAQFDDIYIEQFKLTYFRQLLRKSYNNSNAIREVIQNDYSGFTEPILGEEDFTIIDSLTTIDNQRLVADSTNGRLRAEGAQGKRALGYIMEKLSSRWLDNLARQRLKVNRISGH